MLSWEFGTGWGSPRGAVAAAGPWQKKLCFRRVQDLCTDCCTVHGAWTSGFLERERPTCRKGFRCGRWLLVTSLVVTKVGYKPSGGGPVRTSANKRVVNPLGTLRQTKDLTPSADGSRTKTRTRKCRAFNNLTFSVRGRFAFARTRQQLTDYFNDLPPIVCPKL
jgi:hypothetical protein